jgi:hypothetical protein
MIPADTVDEERHMVNLRRALAAFAAAALADILDNASPDRTSGAGFRARCGWRQREFASRNESGC